MKDLNLELNVPGGVNRAVDTGSAKKLILLAIAAVFFMYGILTAFADDSHSGKVGGMTLNKKMDGTPSNTNVLVLDTVYTDKDVWLELRIDQQMLYIHHKNGKVTSNPVSTGDSSIEKSVSTRSGLFSVFSKIPSKYSSQYPENIMTWYMPFNQGIGFHGTDTAFYKYLGTQPSSHGCIRMIEEDAQALYKKVSLGTLVLAHSGESARTIAFVPDGFENVASYDNKDYLRLLAYNLNALYTRNIINMNPPVRFVIDGTKIPPNGYYVGDIKNLTMSMSLSNIAYRGIQKSEKLTDNYVRVESLKKLPDELAAIFAGYIEQENNDEIYVSEEMINTLAYNERGILPYFPADD